MNHYYAEINIYDSLSTVNPEFVWVLENLESPGILSGHFPRVEKDYRSCKGLKWNLKSWKNQFKSLESHQNLILKMSTNSVNDLSLCNLIHWVIIFKSKSGLLQWSVDKT